MSITVVILTAFALAMDAFSIAVTKGLCVKKLSLKNALQIGIMFGGFQALMPFIGWLAGSGFSGFVSEFSNYIAFALLAFIGMKMIYESVKSKDDEQDCRAITWRSLLPLAVATSIDALAVGLSLSLMENAILLVLIDVLIIGVITFIISMAGYFLGHKLGRFLGSKAEIIGGVVLIILGLKFLLDKFI